MSSLVRDLTLENWLEAPFNRGSFQRVREVVPTARIPRAETVRALPEDPHAFDDLPFGTQDGPQTTMRAHLEQTYADGICILHRGRIVFERYLNGMRPDTPHLLMSVSKSFCGTLTGVLAGQGLLAPDDLVSDHAPDMVGTSLDGATIRHLLDMTAGTKFVEDYAVYSQPESDHELLVYEREAGYRPLGARAPRGVLAAFRDLEVARSHGAVFDYRSPLTNILAHVLERVSGKRYPELLSQELFARIGAEHDAEIMLDPLGFPIAEGGMCCTLRDLARFGQLLLDRGRVGDDQILPAAWVADILDPPASAFEAFAAGPHADTRTECAYRSSFWVVEPGRTFTGLGIFGQSCLVDVEHDIVIARFSTSPGPVPMAWRAESTGALAAICERLA